VVFCMFWERDTIGTLKSLGRPLKLSTIDVRNLVQITQKIRHAPLSDITSEFNKPLEDKVF
jgi:hypothetical protein